MDLTDPPRRPRGESIVPMINVVFLLLIFFLMTSRLAQPDPFDVTPPDAASETAPEAEPVLYIGADGRMHFDGAEGEAALARLAAASAGHPGLQLRADARLEAKILARILRQLAEAGLARAELVVRQP
ncbi:biopolymer transporter ExbD [Leisingera daeponensis]|uniref:Biopolymer transporter ExbD n=1 Tax=Leisingera daeponensis TaxID=405746 RepID=A0ABS7NK30_9RHOB|nr:biopolymer transporter ExbD [Leisingera daeponensis]MBY6057969.1 biopolymer transporter ExbD [Leisingera daeponensis]MBY6141565.1 biopolymer transporter ExbD [Leisingera daeponensis]